MYTTRTTCRVCGSKKLTPLFSLGKHYVSDFVEQDKIHSGEKCPIDLELCQDCTLVQLKHTAPQELLYSRYYWYRSGVTQTMRDALNDVVDCVMQAVKLQPDDVVLDIGSNDGTLLRHYPEWLTTVGVEPAVNLAKEGAEGVDIFISEFWNHSTCCSHKYDFMGRRRAKIITAIGMFYDLEDPSKFIADVAKALHPEGVFIAQLMCLHNMISVGDVGNFCHEHLEYYSMKSLVHLFGKHGLEIFKVETTLVNGRSYRLYVHHKSNPLNRTLLGPVGELIEIEEELGLADPAFYQGFFASMEENRKKTFDFIKSHVDEGFKVWVYGASTKGNTILQYYGLDSTLIAGASDRSPEKWGKYTIGTGIKIFSEEEARKYNPDYFLMLPYAFLDEFMRREKEWRDKGGRFIVPIPEFRIV